MRKLSKKLVAACMTAAMMLTMVPAAFAAEPETELPTFVRPDGTVMETKIYDEKDLQSSITTMSTNAVGTESNPIVLDDAQDFLRADWLQNNYYVLGNNIDLSSLYQNIPAWSALISGFRGHFDGQGYTITGVASDTYLFDYVVGGTIENINFDVENAAAFLVFSPASVRDSATGEVIQEALHMDNITVEGDINLLSASQSNYSPFIYAANPGFEMTNCTNYADITGVTYAAVFYGYSPYLGGKVTFDNCENHGNITLSNAALFFGNPTYFSATSAVINSIDVDIKNCDNYGQIRSMVTDPHYFVTDVGGGLSTFSAGIEGDLLESAGITTQSSDYMLHVGTEDKNCTDPKCLHKEDGTHDGKLYNGPELEGMSVTVGDDGESITITQAEDAVENGVAGYVISLSSYVTIFNTNKTPAENAGTEQVTLQELVPVDSLDENGNYTSALKYYGYADMGLGEAAGTDDSGNAIVTVDGKKYYQLENRASITYAGQSGYLIYASANSFDAAGNLVKSTNTPGTLSVSAVDENGNLLATVYYSVGE